MCPAGTLTKELTKEKYLNHMLRKVSHQILPTLSNLVLILSEAEGNHRKQEDMPHFSSLLLKDQDCSCCSGYCLHNCESILIDLGLLIQVVCLQFFQQRAKALDQGLLKDLSILYPVYLLGFSGRRLGYQQVP